MDLDVAPALMLARATPGFPTGAMLGGAASWEPKWDGWRVALTVTTSGVRVWSRHGKDLTAAFPDIAAAARLQLGARAGVCVDGELVVWTEAGLDFAALARRAVQPSRAARLARELPASFMAFDVLALDDVDVRAQPLHERRQLLEQVMAACSPPLQLTPSTTDEHLARQWLADYAAARVGVEGLVCKGLDDPYRGGIRGWEKYRTTDTVSVLVGAVTNTLTHPERLVIALPDSTGELLIAGGTTPLSPAQSRELGALLTPARADHPWPPELPAGRLGAFGGPRRLPVTLVDPVHVVDVIADTAHEYGHWRHMVRLARLRPDLSPDDVRPLT